MQNVVHMIMALPEVFILGFFCVFLFLQGLLEVRNFQFNIPVDFSLIEAFFFVSNKVSAVYMWSNLQCT